MLIGVAFVGPIPKPSSEPSLADGPPYFMHHTLSKSTNELLYDGRVRACACACVCVSKCVCECMGSDSTACCCRCTLVSLTSTQVLNMLLPSPPLFLSHFTLPLSPILRALYLVHFVAVCLQVSSSRSEASVMVTSTLNLLLYLAGSRC